ncbi:MAG: MOSC domain-containing protein [Planctomycetes bacterium]|nr:MOSC domain-containing protein [Planctomycetota bacterium]
MQTAAYPASMPIPANDAQTTIIPTDRQQHRLTTATRLGMLIAVCTSPGGIPKLPLVEVRVTPAGLIGDGRNHAKHIRPDRAVSLIDREILDQLRAEGFEVGPGIVGENLTVEHLHVQTLAPGTLLCIEQVVLRLEQPRKPCYVLDAIDPQLKDVIAGRCGYMASVVQGGPLRPGMSVRVV